MNRNFKQFLIKYKYDIICGITWFYYCLFLINVCHITNLNWSYWFLILFTIIFRFIGYKEGTYKLSTNLIKYNNDIVVEINNKFTEHVVEIRDLKKGMFFSLVNDESRDKYIKCGDITNGYVTCWNLTSKSFTLIKDTQECILYQTKIIYQPVVKVKEDN